MLRRYPMAKFSRSGEIRGAGEFIVPMGIGYAMVRATITVTNEPTWSTRSPAKHRDMRLSVGSRGNLLPDSTYTASDGRMR
jgi:hypothetical protein